MFKWRLFNPSPRTIIGSVFFAYFLQLQIAVAEVEAPALQYIARRLLPNECQSIVSHELAFDIAPVKKSYKFPPSSIDCFRKLVGWASDLRINRRDANLLLGNRLRQIGRDDLATWLLGPTSRAQEIVEYDSWNSKKDGNRKLSSSSVPTVSKIPRVVFGPPGMKSVPGLPPGLRRESIPKFPDTRKLNGIHNMDSFKDRYSVMVEPGSVNPETSAPQIATGEPAANQQNPGALPEASSTPKEVQNDGRDLNSTTQTPVSGISTPEGKKLDKLKLPLLHFSDEKTAPCFRVPLATALIVIGTIMILTCCCALLLRNRLAACFERLRGKKTLPSKRVSADEEQGFMGPKTIGKPPKRSGRKGGGPIDVANVGVQNNNAASNASLESNEKPTGCCNCCARKKKKNRRKWNR